MMKRLSISSVASSWVLAETGLCCAAGCYSADNPKKPAPLDQLGQLGLPHELHVISPLTGPVQEYQEWPLLVRGIAPRKVER